MAQELPRWARSLVDEVESDLGQRVVWNAMRGRCRRAQSATGRDDAWRRNVGEWRSSPGAIVV